MFKEVDQEMKLGWKNETAIYAAQTARFLQDFLNKSRVDRPRYDDIAELHFSGGNIKVMDKIFEGAANLVEVSVLYNKDNQPEQIHAVFDSEGAGHNIDVYIKGKALEDLLQVRVLGR